MPHFRLLQAVVHLVHITMVMWQKRRVRALPVEGCTMPPVPPIPNVRWGNLGSTPPMGIRQYSSSVMDLTLIPKCSILHKH